MRACTMHKIVPTHADTTLEACKMTLVKHERANVDGQLDGTYE
jgi:hypothetical protein